MSDASGPATLFFFPQLWANFCPDAGWVNVHDTTSDISCWPSKEVAEAEARGSQTTHLVGVSPARLAAVEAERDSLKSQRDNCHKAWVETRELLGRVRARAEKAEAELARRDAEAARPIGVGDVVQYRSNSLGLVIEKPGECKKSTILRVSLLHEYADQAIHPMDLTRIGRAARMPDGSPVPPVEGSV